MDHSFGRTAVITDSVTTLSGALVRSADQDEKRPLIILESSGAPF